MSTKITAKILFKLAALVLSTFLFTHSAYSASSNRYKVEVLIFTHITANAYQSQVWPADPGTPSLQKAILLGPVGNNMSQIYQLLPSNNFSLNHAAQALASQPNFKIILHQAWIQPLSSHPQFIYLVGGTEYTTNSYQLIGTLGLSVTNYINVKADFLLTEPRSTLPTQEKSDFQGFRLVQVQRMRNNEVHYYDNPLFGMLIKVTRV